MHLTRYPKYHVSLLTYSLSSEAFMFYGPYTSLMLHLGFTTHERNPLYFQYSVHKANHMCVSSCLLLNNRAIFRFLVFEQAHCLGVLSTIIKTVSTPYLLWIFNQFRVRHCTNARSYNDVIETVQREFLSRGIIFTPPCENDIVNDLRNAVSFLA